MSGLYGFHFSGDRLDGMDEQLFDRNRCHCCRRSQMYLQVLDLVANRQSRNT